MKAKMTFTTALKQVDSITDRLGKPVDARIRNLLAAMIMVGIRTTMSCSGHSGKKGLSYPWIEFDVRDILLVENIIGHQNRPRKESGRTNRNIWVILPSHRPRIVPWNTSKSLKTMQREAEEFATRMQRIYARRSTRS